MTVTSQTFAVSVTASGGTPGSNEVTLIGGGTYPTLYSLAAHPRLSGWPTYKIGYAFGGAYGSGAFVPGYGAQGSFITAATSGDSAPQINDAIIFDFASETWSLQANVDGIANSQSTTYCTNNHPPDPATTSGEPYFEMIGHPGHPHAGQWYGAGIGHGNKLIRTLGSFMGGDLRTTKHAHQYDPTAQDWTLLTSTEATLYTSNWAVQINALYDANHPNGPRVWFVFEEPVYGTYLPYLDLTTNAYGTVASQGALASGQSYNWNHALLHDDGTRRCILVFKSRVLSGNTLPSNYAQVLNLDNIGAGWTYVSLLDQSSQNATFAQFAFSTYSGITPAPTNQLTTRWAYYPANGKHYTTDGLSGTITEISPPASGITGTWTTRQITPTNMALPTMMQGGGDGETSNLPHFTRFFYVPARDSFAWVPGGSKKVALWKP